MIDEWKIFMQTFWQAIVEKDENVDGNNCNDSLICVNLFQNKRLSCPFPCSSTSVWKIFELIENDEK